MAGGLPSKARPEGRKHIDIPEFLRVIELHQEAIENAKHFYQARLAPEFNPFESIEPDERKLSRIVAWLLDPLGSHGQGGRFLGLFLETLGAPWPADVCEKATARTEFFVGNGSIDVYVKSACGILAIENKPWAGDQAKQLHRYFAHLAQAGLIKYCIVYLTEDGRDPPADSICESERTLRIEAEQLRLWSYPGKIVEWLTRCRNACRADRVVMFIDEFIRYIQQEFQGVRDMTTQEHLVEKVTGSPEMILPAMQVAFAGDAIRNKLLSMLHNQLETAVRKQGWIDVEWEMDAYSRDSYLGIDFSPKCPSKFGLQFEETRFRNPYYGAYKKDMTRADDGGVGSALVGLGQARQNDEWPWYRDASSRKRRSSAATEARNR